MEKRWMCGNDSYSRKYQIIYLTKEPQDENNHYR